MQTTAFLLTNQRTQQHTLRKHRNSKRTNYSAGRLTRPDHTWVCYGRLSCRKELWVTCSRLHLLLLPLPAWLPRPTLSPSACSTQPPDLLPWNSRQWSPTGCHGIDPRTAPEWW